MAVNSLQATLAFHESFYFNMTFHEISLYMINFKLGYVFLSICYDKHEELY